MLRKINEGNKEMLGHMWSTRGTIASIQSKHGFFH